MLAGAVVGDGERAAMRVTMGLSMTYPLRLGCVVPLMLLLLLSVPLLRSSVVLCDVLLVVGRWIRSSLVLALEQRCPVDNGCGVVGAELVAFREERGCVRAVAVCSVDHGMVGVCGNVRGVFVVVVVVRGVLVGRSVTE